MNQEFTAAMLLESLLKVFSIEGIDKFSHLCEVTTFTKSTYNVCMVEEPILPKEEARRCLLKSIQDMYRNYCKEAIPEKTPNRELLELFYDD